MHRLITVFIKIFVLAVLALGQSFNAYTENSPLTALTKEYQEGSPQLKSFDFDVTNSPVHSHAPFTGEPCSEMEIEEEPEKINHESEMANLLGDLILLAKFPLYPDLYRLKVTSRPKGIWKPPQNRA